MPFTKEQVLKAIDHSVLKPTATDQDVLENAKLCVHNGVGDLCVRPTDVKAAAEALKGSDITVACVVGFPHGSNRPEVKALEARFAIEDGADELDMVMNIGQFLSGNFDHVQRDIEAVVAEAKPKGVLVKVILEICYLTPDQIAQACTLAQAAGADFVKTSTGFGDHGATPEAIDIMIETVGDTMQVKAAGGVRGWDTAVAFLEQGCTRLGAASGTKKIIEEAPSTDDGEY
ncbi:MAG: deoxyribose-phosphate aldolase [Candidatus Brocadiae bacterium]|nr:deoxyribose-phosphate aldolase [Candidatus Brocadiia bacterium]